MRKLLAAAAATLALAACSTDPRPLVPDTAQGPASYVCYNSAASTPDEVRSIAERQCSKAGLGVSGLIGQTFTPFRCGVLTPSVAAFQCGTSSQWLAPLPPLAAPAQ
ncbi:MAG TPA: hypothetical protein VL974_13230 [Magnetospirillum sp.]|jgi:hypothetical protein|nr:hypothetical protein [Magnetospirillum sp.]